MTKIEQQKIQKAKTLVVALEEGVNGHYLSGGSVPCRVCKITLKGRGVIFQSNVHDMTSFINCSLIKIDPLIPFKNIKNSFFPRK